MISSYSISRYSTELVLDNTVYNGVYPELTLPVFENPQVSIIIPAYNQWDYTYKCVASVLKHTALAYEVIVADDNSTDETQQLEDYIKNAVHIRNTENLMFLRNCNNAAKYTKGKYICLLNNDTQVQPGWLKALVDIIERDDSIGIAGSKFVFPDGRLQEAGSIVFNGPNVSVSNYGRYDSPARPDYNYVKEVDYISGASILVRKSLWDKLGGFDGRFVPAYYEDIDLAFSARQMGYNVVYQPKSVVVHCAGISSIAQDVAASQKQNARSNAGVFYGKWKHILAAEHFPQGEDVFYARDRSHGKKVILIISDKVPSFNNNPDDDSVISSLKLCVESGCHVIFIGDDFIQHEPGTGLLEQMGIMVLSGPFYRDDWKMWLKHNGKYIGYVWFNSPDITERYIDAVKWNTNAGIVYFETISHIKPDGSGDRTYKEASNDVQRILDAADYSHINCASICSEREIVIWGTGKDAYDAAEKIRRTWWNEVSFFVSKDWMEKPRFMGKAVRSKDILNREKHFVVIGSNAYYNEIADELQQLGFEHGKNYCRI